MLFLLLLLSAGNGSWGTKPFQLHDNTAKSNTTKSSTKWNSIPQAGIWCVLSCATCVDTRTDMCTRKGFWRITSADSWLAWSVSLGMGACYFLIMLVWPPTHCLHPWVASNSHSSVLSLFYVEQFVTSIPIRNSWRLLHIKMAYKMAWRFLPAGFIIFWCSLVQKVLGHLSHT